MATPTSAPATTAVAGQLRATMRGDVLVAEDTDYESARQIWNAAIDRRPAVIARCADQQDVVAAVCAAREHNLPLSVRGGGHDWAGRAIRGGGLVIDLTGQRRVTVRPDNGTADVQGGVHAGDILTATHQCGFMPVTGTIKDVGLNGLTLAGGYGLLAGAHGLALDNLVHATVVLADGTLATASPADDADLFWALRGGGGNFGVVTSARYRVHPAGLLWAGLLLYPMAQATSVLRGLRDLFTEAPDELTVMSGFFCDPTGTPLLFLLPAWAGELAAGEPWVARVRSLGTPAVGEVSAMSYLDVLGQFDGTAVAGQHREMRTCWLAELTDDAIGLIVDAITGITSPLSGLFLHNFHGAAARVPAADTAFALRRDHVLVEIAAGWTASPTDYGVEHRQWARALLHQLVDIALPGGYANLLGADEPERALVGYGHNAARLLALKQRFDPDHVFSAVPELSAGAITG